MPAARPLLRHALTLLFSAGVTLALWPCGQAAYGIWSQHRLRAAWSAASTDRPPAAPVSRLLPDRTPPSAPEAASTSDPPPAATSGHHGWPLTRLIIPDINLDVVVLDGDDESTLRRAPGHLPESGLPGETGNCVIAGHRNIYGSWFYRLDELWAGSLVQLRTHHHTYSYRVLSIAQVSDVDGTILQPPDPSGETAWLTLVTCTLPHSTNRMAIFCRLESGDDATP